MKENENAVTDEISTSGNETTYKAIDWKTVVNRLDLILFFIFLVIAFLSATICLVLCSAGNYKGWPTL